MIHFARTLLLLAFIGASTSASAQTVEQSLIRGLTHMRTAKFEDAITVYTEALRKAPDEPALLTAMAEAHAANGDPGAGVFFSGSAVRIAPDHPDVLRVHAAVSMDAGNMEDALQSLRHLLDLRPTDSQAAVNLLTIYLQLDRISDALAADASLAERFPAQPDVLALRADVLEQAGRTDQLISVLERLSGFRDVGARLAGAYMQAGGPARAPPGPPPPLALHAARPRGPGQLEVGRIKHPGCGSAPGNPGVVRRLRGRE